MSEEKERKALEDVHQRALKRFKLSVDADRIQAEKAVEDLIFFEGDQWSEEMKKKFDEKGRPRHTINLMPEKIDFVIGDQRQNSPLIKVRPVDSKADPETAEKLDGLIRSIMKNSDGELIVDHATENATKCGRGAFRVLTDYEGPDTFDQEIILQWIPDVMTVKWDPGAIEYDKQDGMYMFISEQIPKETYKEKHPDKSLESWPDEATDKGLTEDWHDVDNVVVAEYFEKIAEEIDIVLLEDGRVIELKEMKSTDKELRRRKAETNKIIWYKMNGKEIIEGPTEFPSKYFPILFIWGKETIISGKRHIRGMVRNGKDAQRMINYTESLTMESLVMAPRAPFQGTAKQIEGHQNLYNAAATGEIVSVLLYNPDASAANAKPTQTKPPSVPSGLEHRSAVSKDNLKSTMGIYDASVGAEGNETSGVAITKRINQGDRGTFVYTDNRNRTLKTLGTLLVDMVPRVYDADRIVRIVGPNDKIERVHFAERPENYNHENLKPEERIYDPKVGKYDVIITVGANYASQREEMANGMIEIIRVAPDCAPIILSRLAKALDWNDADQLAEDLEVLLPPELRAKRMAERGEAPGTLPDEGAPVEVPVDESQIVKGKIDIATAKLELLEKAKNIGLPPDVIDQIGQEIEGKIE